MGAAFERPGFWIVIVVLVLLLFGAKRLPDLSRSVGRSLRIFKAETDGMRAGDRDDGASLAAEESGRQVAGRAAKMLVDPVTGERVLAEPVQDT